MTNIPMPDPVAVVVTGVVRHLKQTKERDAFITTTQAEAYADARVREALEPGFDKAFALLSAWMRSTQAVADMGQVATLSSLVEFALANQGKTSDQLEAEYKLPGPASHNHS